MSWLTGLADKAENLLNKIDQNAAAVLQEKDKSGYLSNVINMKTDIRPEKVKQEGTHIVDLKSFDSSYDRSNERNTPTKQAILKGKSLKKTNRKAKNFPKKSDLNATSCDIVEEASDTFIKSEKYLLNLESSVDASPEHKCSIVSENNMSDVESPRPSHENDPGENYSHSGDTSVTTEFNDDYHNSSTDPQNYINMENQMLRNEISVVNNEVSLLLNKAKNAEKISENTQTRLQHIEKLYTQTVIEKESLLDKVQKYEQTQKAPKDTEDRSELEDSVRSLEADKKHLQDEIRNLELSLMSNISMKSEFESEMNISKTKCSELQEKLDKAKSESANILLELKNYKVRANNTLMMKDKIIAELGGKEESSNSESNPLNTQISQLQIERDELVEEAFKYQTECETRAKEFEQLEYRMRSTERQVSALREALRQEKAAKEMAEHTVASLSKELMSVQAETAKQISSLRTKLKENMSRENERHQNSSSRSSLNVSESGEDRFRSLTQALVSKQAALESITSDRNALRLQLEKTENKYRSDLVSMRNNQPRIINLNDTDDVKARFPHMMQESPWDSSLSRHVKKAYSTLDSFSVRVGVFLRRNPIARIFIISYMIILHLWVFIVLFTYTPEIHPSSENKNN